MLRYRPNETFTVWDFKENLYEKLKPVLDDCPDGIYNIDAKFIHDHDVEVDGKI